MSDFETFGLFGGAAIEEIPEDNNLPVGEYDEVVIESAKAQKTKSGNSQGVAVNYKDISEDGFGQTAFKWIAFPVPANRASYLLKDLKNLGIRGDSLIEFARSVDGSDPETCEVDFDRINAVLADCKGRTGKLEISEYTNKNTGNKGTNVRFTIYDDDESFIDSEANAEKPETTTTTQADTSSWFS